MAGVEGQIKSSSGGGTKELVHVCLSPPIIVGAWSIAIVLWQLREYYYICIHLLYCLSTVAFPSLAAILYQIYICYVTPGFPHIFSY